MDNIIVEQGDLEPVQDLPEMPGIPETDSDLEPLPGEDGEDGGMDEGSYQYTLTVKEQDNEEGDSGIEPEFVFVLTPKEEEGEEIEDDLESIEDVGAGIENAQAPQASVAPSAAPLPESVWKDLEPIITEQEAPIAPAGGENTPPPAPEAAVPPAGEEPLPEEEPELEEANVEMSSEDLKSFIEGSEIEVKFSIDEETEFSIDEAIDFLKLYPETEVFVTVKGDIEEFKEKLEEFQSGKEEASAEVEAEEQNVMVDNEGDSLDLKNTPQANPATPEVSRESFSIFNFKNKKNLPDGIYIGNLLENKLYGRIDVKLTADKMILGKDIFKLEEKINIADAKDKESINLLLKESEGEKLNKVLAEKAEITVDLNKI
jgi:hypothetical protein